MTKRFLSFPKPSIKSDFKIACFWRHFLQKWQQNWPFLPPLFIEEKSWRQNGLVLVAKFFKMTAKLNGFAVNYKIRKSGNLTKACACHRRNREIRPLQELSSAFFVMFQVFANFDKDFSICSYGRRRKKTVQSFAVCLSFRAAYRLSFNFRFVIKDKSVFGDLSWFHVFMRRSKERTTPLTVLLQPKMLLPKNAPT